MRATQRHRAASVWTPFAPDRFLLRRAVIHERLSQPFEMTLEVQEQGDLLDGDELIGQSFQVRVDSGLTDRVFHGMVSEVRDRLDPDQPGVRDITLRPWFWFLRHRVDCRIFQNQTAPEIIELVLRSAGCTDYELQLGEDYQKREYCVQYRESDFDFVSRLLQEEGIRYFFRHEQVRHLLVLADAIAMTDTIPGLETAVYHPKSEGTQYSHEHVNSWSRLSSVSSGAHSYEDYDFKVPRKPLKTVALQPRAHALGDLEIFDYPGKYDQSEVGQRLSRVRIEEVQTNARVYHGQGPLSTLACGYGFFLFGHDSMDPSMLLTVRETRFVITADDYGTGSTKDRERQPLILCSFTAADAMVPFRPARATARPQIPGPQTAIVTGPSGEEIHTDEHGRVIVQFHWDRYGERNENSSCWIRVAQPWAGNKWGGLALPRIGQEVVVEFLDGDPDRPIINGRFYNGDMKPPQDLPHARANMSIRSQSYPGGGGSNEITMNDTLGEEQFYFHAQYDMETAVENDSRRTVGNDDHTDVTGFQTLHVGKDQSVAVDLNAQETVGINKKISVGSSLLIEAGTSITLKCGASSIHMNQAGVITISGSLVTMVGSINANVAAPITNIAGAALLTKMGAVNLTFGSVVRSFGSQLANLESGGQAEVLGGSETLIQGGKVKIN